MLPYPDIDPIALQLGPLAIRWYSLAYIGGIVFGWWYFRWLHRLKAVPGLTKEGIDDMVVWATIGIVGGGRLGYVLFYKPLYYLEHPLAALKLWDGGMSFHGGLIGTILAFFLFARRYRIPFWPLMDTIACTVPIGLGLGRIANFINGELFGRVTDAPLGMVFPHGGPLPRHPSQLYEATLEGVGLLLLLFLLARFTRIRDRPGRLSGAFLVGYASARIVCELFREPDAHLGFLVEHLTMGQLLCIPMLILGFCLLLRRPRAPEHPVP